MRRSTSAIEKQKQPSTESRENSAENICTEKFLFFSFSR